MTESKYGFGVNYVFPKLGYRYLKVHVSLANVSAPVAVPTHPGRFSIEVDNNSTTSFYDFNPLGSGLPEACDGFTNVARGEQVDCWVMFEIPGASNPVAMRYIPAADTVTYVRAPFLDAPSHPLVCEAWSWPGKGTGCSTCITTYCNTEDVGLNKAQPACYTAVPQNPCTPAPYCDCERARLLTPDRCVPLFDAYAACVGTQCMKQCSFTD